MSTLTIILAIAIPVAYLIGRYYKSISKTSFDSLEKARDYWQAQHRETWDENRQLEADLRHAKHIAANSPKVMIVPNINPHHAADKEYIGIYPNNGLEPAHLTREEYQKGVDRLKDNPEDNILTNKN
jgi:hypothetical protein